jgi:hypothetical protein
VTTLVSRVATGIMAPTLVTRTQLVTEFIIYYIYIYYNSASSVNVDTRLQSIRQQSSPFLTSLSGAKIREQSSLTAAQLCWGNLTLKNHQNLEKRRKNTGLFSCKSVILSKKCFPTLSACWLPYIGLGASDYEVNVYRGASVKVVLFILDGL